MERNEHMLSSEMYIVSRLFFEITYLDVLVYFCSPIQMQIKLDSLLSFVKYIMNNMIN